MTLFTAVKVPHIQLGKARVKEYHLSLVKRLFSYLDSNCPKMTSSSFFQPQVENIRPIFPICILLSCLSTNPWQQGTHLRGIPRKLEKGLAWEGKTARNDRALGGHDLVYPPGCLTLPFLSFQTIVLKMESFFRLSIKGW